MLAREKTVMPSKARIRCGASHRVFEVGRVELYLGEMEYAQSNIVDCVAVVERATLVLLFFLNTP